MEKSSSFRKAVIFLVSLSVTGASCSPAAAGLSERDSSRARYFSKTIPHRGHSVFPSGCSNQHFGRFTAHFLPRAWFSRFPLYTVQQILSMFSFGQRGGGLLGGERRPHGGGNYISRCGIFLMNVGTSRGSSYGMRSEDTVFTAIPGVRFLERNRPEAFSATGSLRGVHFFTCGSSTFSFFSSKKRRKNDNLGHCR